MHPARPRVRAIKKKWSFLFIYQQDNNKSLPVSGWPLLLRAVLVEDHEKIQVVVLGEKIGIAG